MTSMNEGSNNLSLASIFCTPSFSNVLLNDFSVILTPSINFLIHYFQLKLLSPDYRRTGEFTDAKFVAKLTNVFLSLAYLCLRFTISAVEEYCFSFQLLIFFFKGFYWVNNLTFFGFFFLGKKLSVTSSTSSVMILGFNHPSRIQWS